MNLIIDGNYILNRNVFSLTKDKLLYGYLEETLEKNIKTYSNWFPFDNIYFISDVKRNWRKNIYPDYKGNRKKSTDIDWDFVNTVYTEFKSKLPKRVKLLERDLVEGDDWFYYLAKYHNDKNESIMMVSNDGDLQQLLTSRSGKYMNLMVNENRLHDNIFLPIEYKTWLADFYQNMELPDLFDDTTTYDMDLYKFIQRMISPRTVKSVKHDQIIFEKIICGDTGDNIKTCWSKPDKSGKLRGYGIKGANKIYKKYVEHFGDPDFSETCFDTLVDLIIEDKKLDQLEFEKIHKDALFNNKLVNLSEIPKDIINLIKDSHERTFS